GSGLMGRHSAGAVASTAIVAVGASLVLHELAHALVGALVGGRPTLITAMEVRGDFTALSPAGRIALGAAGMATNALMAAAAYAALRVRSGVRRAAVWSERASAMAAAAADGAGGGHRPAPGASPAGASALDLFLWFVLAYGGVLTAAKTASETAAGWGDWMTILRAVPHATVVRALALVLGTAGLLWMVRLSRRMLSGLLVATTAPERRLEGLRLIATAGFACAVLGSGAAVTSGVGAPRALALAAGAILGPFVVLGLSLAVRRQGRAAPTDLPRTPAVAGLGWTSAAAVVVILMWGVFGPGLRLGG
ncbi:MAG: hypothetical protein D6701_06195, partial [Gemmatimonadetes bacterium]